MSKKKVKVNWYQVLYAQNDEKLIAAFWKFFNSHRMSKNRCARYVLQKYYSTTSMPVDVKKYFTLRHDIKLVSLNLYEM